jgi:hypothetical protein
MIVSSTRTVSIVRDRLFVPVIGAYIGHLSREEVGTRVLGPCPDLWRTAFTKDPDFVFALLQRDSHAPWLGEGHAVTTVQRSGPIVTIPILSGLHHRYERI